MNSLLKHMSKIDNKGFLETASSVLKRVKGVSHYNALETYQTLMNHKQFEEKEQKLLIMTYHDHIQVLKEKIYYNKFKSSEHLERNTIDRGDEVTWERMFRSYQSYLQQDEE